MARVLDRGVLSGAGAPEMRALEAEFAAAVSARFCIPALSFIATAQAVLHQSSRSAALDRPIRP